MRTHKLISETFVARRLGVTRDDALQALYMLTHNGQEDVPTLMYFGQTVLYSLQEFTFS